MLTKISVEIENNPIKAGIELKSTLTGVTATDIDQVVILRQRVGASIWDTVYDMDISSIDDLEFDLLDILAAGNEKYNYSIDLKSNGTTVESQVFDIEEECWFEGMLIGNFETQYLAPLDWQVNCEKKTSVAYVNTLAGRTPYRVSNSDNNYYTGSASGLFMPIVDGKPVVEYNHAYHKQVVDFLSDGTNKILKTSDGQMWYISVDDTITVPFDDRFKGRNTIEFNWTEIGDVPPSGMVIL